MKILSEPVLHEFCTKIFGKVGLSQDDAKICSDVLIRADLRGIHSHGVASLARYIDGIEERLIIPQNKAEIIKESPVSLLVNGNAAMGMPTGNMVMQELIKKATASGMAVATVKNSNHFGFGAFYAMQALKHNLLGLALTNTASIAVPTYGTQAKIGSNAISFAAPSNSCADFVLDMSTATVPRGLIKEYADNNKAMPEGWALDRQGNYICDASELLRILAPPTDFSEASEISKAPHSGNANAIASRHGGLVPLGGKDTMFGGHKGYGLALMVDILTGILSGFKASYQIRDSEKAAGRSSQTFIAINIGLFRDIDDFKQDMDAMLLNLQNSEAIDGHSVKFHGQQSSELESQQKADGIRLLASTYRSLEQIAVKYSIEFP